MSTIRVMAMVEASIMSGTARAVLEFAREASRGRPGIPKIELSILTFDRGNASSSFGDAIREAGVPHDVVRESGRFDTAVIPQLRAAAARRNSSLVWSNSVKSNFLVRWSGLNQSRRWVAFHHGYTTTDAKMRMYNQLDRWSLPAADRVLTSSAAFVGELEKRNVRRGNIHVQHMPARPSVAISEEQKEKLRRELRLERGSRILLSVGRLSREKGHADLIHAFRKMRAAPGGLPLHLVLVGEGPERKKIEELCGRMDLTGDVTLAGQQENVRAYYAIADVFLLPSRSEGCPNVLLEAMAAGVPVVATEVGGIPEVVTSGRDAILVKAGDAEALAPQPAGFSMTRTFAPG